MACSLVIHMGNAMLRSFVHVWLHGRQDSIIWTASRHQDSMTVGFLPVSRQHEGVASPALELLYIGLNHDVQQHMWYWYITVDANQQYRHSLPIPHHCPGAHIRGSPTVQENIVSPASRPMTHSHLWLRALPEGGRLLFPILMSARTCQSHA